MKWLKVGAVVFGAVLITALGIDAADTMSGSRSTLLGQIIQATPQGTCPAGMVEAPMATTFTCVDTYEASPSKECPYPNPTNDKETQANMNEPACKATSQENTDAWKYVSREQALTACVRAGKRLPQADEWYLASVGTLDTQESCNINTGSLAKTGAHASCVSALGAYDMIGNVWEWTADDVIKGVYNGRELPKTGYVAQVDASGIAVLTSEQESELFGKDFFWTQAQGAFGMIRGGFYGSKSDAGVYSVHADTLPTTSGTAIGFRCVK